MKSIKNNLNHGLTLVEVLIATSIILVFLMALLGAHNLYFQTALANGEVVKGAYLAEEGVEVVRFLRDSSWDTNIAPLVLDTDYYLVWTGGTWQTTTTQSLIDSVFERTITLSAVYRDVSADIVSSGGTLDPNTLLVVSSVSWPKNGVTVTKSISTYLTNIFDN